MICNNKTELFFKPKFVMSTLLSTTFFLEFMNINKMFPASIYFGHIYFEFCICLRLFKHIIYGLNIHVTWLPS